MVFLRSGERLFPLFVLAVLAGLTFWLERLSQPRAEATDDRQRHDPDFYVDGLQLRRFDDEGRLQYSLFAQRMVHYPDDDTTEVLAPRLSWHRAPVQVLSADRATIDGPGETVILEGNVQLTRPATRQALAMTVQTPVLTVHPERETVHTEAPVVLTQGRSRIEGQGLIADRQRAVLGGPARGTLYPRQKAMP